MERDGLPEDPAKQWEVLLCIIAFEEKKIDRRPDGAIEALTYFYNHKGIRCVSKHYLFSAQLLWSRRRRSIPARAGHLGLPSCCYCLPLFHSEELICCSCEHPEFLWRIFIYYLLFISKLLANYCIFIVWVRVPTC